jgi:hypothetical protein
MRTPLLWLVVCFVSLAATSRHGVPVSLPSSPPAVKKAALTPVERVIRLHIEYDEALAGLHGELLEDYLRDAIAIVNVEWSRYRREWFELGELTRDVSAPDLDASYVLARFLHRTTEQPDTIHVNITGRPLEVYTSGTNAMPIGGLAYRGSDAIVISATPGVTADLLAYYLFHELGRTSFVRTRSRRASCATMPRCASRSRHTTGVRTMRSEVRTTTPPMQNCRRSAPSAPRRMSTCSSAQPRRRFGGGFEPVLTPL